MVVFVWILCMVDVLWFFSSFSLFWQFLPTKAANLANYGFKKSEKPPNRKYGGFSAVFVRFLAVFHYFADFYWPNRLIWQVMDYGNLKNRQTANMAVFRRFLCGFCRFLSGFWLFWWFLTAKPANLANNGFWKSEKPPNRQYGGFSGVLCGFCRFLSSFWLFWWF